MQKINQYVRNSTKDFADIYDTGEELINSLIPFCDDIEMLEQMLGYHRLRGRIDPNKRRDSRIMRTWKFKDKKKLK